MWQLKKKQLIMVPTDDPSNIYLHSKLDTLHFLSAVAHQIGVYNGTNQFIHAISPEIPDINDPWINVKDPTLGVRIATPYDVETISKKKAYHCQKIIASTDPSLNKIGVPGFRKSFQNKFVKAYNQKEPIKMVAIEYDRLDSNPYYRAGGGPQCDELVVSVDEKNCVTTHKITETYTREQLKTEMIELLNQDFITFEKSYGIKGWDEFDNWFNTKFI